jgi:Zn-dependent protease with chaperone function
MSIPTVNETFVFFCVALITAAPFFFRYWLSLYPVRTLESIDLTTSRLSILIFVALFAGAFVFGHDSRKTGEVLLCAAILSFSILYQTRFRHIEKQNQEKLPVVSRTRPGVAKRIALGKLGFLTIICTLCLVLMKVPFLAPLLLLAYPFFTPRLLRLQYPSIKMAESDLKTELRGIFARAKTKLTEIYILDSGVTQNPNAMMAKNTLFITLDLFEKLDETELKAVICHEASHLKAGHLWKRLLASTGYFMLVVFWFVFPTALAFTGSIQAIVVAGVFALCAHTFFISKMIARQELEADLGAVHLGASSDSLISALYKLSPEKTPTTHWTTRLIFGVFHPTLAQREATLRAGVLPRPPKLQVKSFAWAYSLFVVGYVFHVAQTLDLNAGRTVASVANAKPDPAKVSHLDEASDRR